MEFAINQMPTGLWKQDGPSGVCIDSKQPAHPLSSYPIGLEMNCKDILKNMILEAERQFCTFLFLLNRKLE